MGSSLSFRNLLPMRFFHHMKRGNASKISQKCDLIEARMLRWLLSIPVEAYQSPVLIILREAIADTANIPLQRAALTMLAMIASATGRLPAQRLRGAYPTAAGAGRSARRGKLPASAGRRPVRQPGRD